MPLAKKYKLFAAADAGVTPPCAFFASGRGCRQGDTCKFAHESFQSSSQKILPPAIAQPNPIPDTGSVVSSESEGEMPQKKTVKIEEASKNVNSDLDFPFAKDVAVKEQGKATTGNGKKRNHRSKASNENPFANPKKLKSAHAESPFESKGKDKEQEPSVVLPVPKPTLPVAAIPNFRSLNLPVASFTALADQAMASPTKNHKSPDTSVHTPSLAPVPTEPEVVKKNNYVQPTSTVEGRQWAKWVAQTQAHSRFESSFDFDKYQQLDAAIGLGGSWIEAKPYGPWCTQSPTLVAMDCEMCETQDPVSLERDPRALCRLSILDATSGEVLLDTLVKPNWPVVDHRSRINGITAQHLEPVQFTLRHAQAFLLALCSQETILIGHALHNDLAALRMKHSCVVDSVCLYKAADSNDRGAASVSLRDLVGQVLHEDMPHIHDSVNDARMAWRCVEHYVQRDGVVADVVRTPSHKAVMATQLFVHRIPQAKCQASHLPPMFVLHTSIEPIQVEDIEFSNGMGKTHVVFRSAKHADLAFETLEGTPEEDASGRLQKKVYLKGGGYIRIRKMLGDKNNHEAARRASTS